MNHIKIPVIVSGNSGSGGFDWYPADTPFVTVIERYQNEIAIWADGEPTSVRLLLVEVPEELDRDTITDYLEGLSMEDDLEFNLPAILEDVPQEYYDILHADQEHVLDDSGQSDDEGRTIYQCSIPGCKETVLGGTEWKLDNK